MSDKKRKLGSRLFPVREAIGRLPVWVWIVVALVAAELAGMAVAFGLNQSEVAVLAFHAVILTVLVGITYKYARSTDEMAKATIDLAQATREELLLRRAETEAEEGIVLNEGLLELRKADMNLRPPFEVGAWGRYCGKLKMMNRLTESDKTDIERCYEQLTRENIEPNRWTEIDLGRQGSVTHEKQCELRRLEEKYKKENSRLSRDAIRAVEAHLKD